MHCTRCKDKNFLIECACGCRKVRTLRNTAYAYRKFLKGHSGRGKPRSEEFKAKMRSIVGEKASGWKGGKWHHGKGYIMILVPDHPFANSYGYVMEHRLVMEKYLGRYLVPNVDDVHHINGIKDDNRLENLELMTHGEHTTLHNNIRYGNLKN